VGYINKLEGDENNLVPITIDDFVKSFVKTNKEFTASEFKEILEEAVKKKASATKCNVCGQPIWAIGTAVSGWDGCFTCISGEADNSEDYEIDTVC